VSPSARRLPALAASSSVANMAREVPGTALNSVTCRKFSPRLLPDGGFILRGIGATRKQQAERKQGTRHDLLGGGENLEELEARGLAHHRASHKYGQSAQGRLSLQQRLAREDASLASLEERKVEHLSSPNAHAPVTHRP